jgi:3D (Asp-Asp-Asp) domain-containing protein
MQPVLRVLFFLPAVALCVSLTACRSEESASPETVTFVATAYALDGITKSGSTSRRGTVAADPEVLPLGSVIRITGAGEYSGIYKVVDTGPKVQGRRIDIYMPDFREAREFGRREVAVEVIENAD